jgi:hypothetical protein
VLSEVPGLQTLLRLLGVFVLSHEIGHFKGGFFNLFEGLRRGDRRANIELQVCQTRSGP